MGMSPPDPSQQMMAIEKVAAKMLEENEKVKFRYHAFCVKNGLSGGIATQAQVDELWRYLNAEAREFNEIPGKAEVDAKAAARLAALKGDPKGKGKKGDKGGKRT